MEKITDPHAQVRLSIARPPSNSVLVAARVTATTKTRQTTKTPSERTAPSGQNLPPSASLSWTCPSVLSRSHLDRIPSNASAPNTMPRTRAAARAREACAFAAMNRRGTAERARNGEGAARRARHRGSIVHELQTVGVVPGAVCGSSTRPDPPPIGVLRIQPRDPPDAAPASRPRPRSPPPPRARASTGAADPSSKDPRRHSLGSRMPRERVPRACCAQILIRRRADQAGTSALCVFRLGSAW